MISPFFLSEEVGVMFKLYPFTKIKNSLPAVVLFSPLRFTVSLTIASISLFVSTINSSNFKRTFLRKSITLPCEIESGEKAVKQSGGGRLYALPAPFYVKLQQFTHGSGGDSSPASTTRTIPPHYRPQ